MCIYIHPGQARDPNSGCIAGLRTRGMVSVVGDVRELWPFLVALVVPLLGCRFRIPIVRIRIPGAGLRTRGTSRRASAPSTTRPSSSASSLCRSAPFSYVSYVGCVCVCAYVCRQALIQRVNGQFVVVVGEWGGPEHYVTGVLCRALRKCAKHHAALAHRR